MLTLLLTVVLSGTAPASVEGWAGKACPAPTKEPDSNVEFKAGLEARATCLKKAMNQAIDRVLLPLRKKDATAFKQWMGLQADYNRWMADACAAVEEANWVDLASGERSMGTGYGGTEQECLQRQYAWRGFYADAWARGDGKALSAALEAYAQQAPKAQERLRQYQAQAQAAAAQAPAQVEQSDTPSQKLSREDWKAYNGRLERAASAPKALAERQCALVPKASPSCAESFRASLVTQLDFSNALGASGGP
ncbi:hypothetical protein [Stigmatella aurantiaca]|uniref:Uncharacterized protein n=1 Tax=Stigmatella aurantiaca (strain DW4/3-1) TaxID=378806 RepID=Q08NU2_STIAD|nr:hypothetical protein [Stigmatella aurantiaca]ADO71882.1 uncharacterized protein STAUR_4098 [Stigmatella aurantiaca DW4/3-1]EAU62152.1 hypothetical protein STIAU_1918 [Stigmatella aurantiaca DW4/3-1]